ncbi:hypothetical protein N7493_008241 [Penicillium malachiteum]|uniref:Uncharacterized protein n=1 Tax=Penicillium malachiteum TaxID=1324776 RepID=A0AAD6HGY4_9EURO|nr:hypothetical protein N7493_008241 [Penicillium malachiteum]
MQQADAKSLLQQPMASGDKKTLGKNAKRNKARREKKKAKRQEKKKKETEDQNTPKSTESPQITQPTPKTQNQPLQKKIQAPPAVLQKKPETAINKMRIYPLSRKNQLSKSKIRGKGRVGQTGRGAGSSRKPLRFGKPRLQEELRQIEAEIEAEKEAAALKKDDDLIIYTDGSDMELNPPVVNK